MREDESEKKWKNLKIVLDTLSHLCYNYRVIQAIRLDYLINAPQAQKMKGHITMAVRKHTSNIQNIAFTIQTEDGKAGLELSQAVVNGRSAGVGFRTINGARKSAQIRLDRQCMEDLRDAVNEILEQEFQEEG